MESNNCQEGDTYDERITITPQPQSSITIMDQKTGQIKAMVGGRGEKASSLGLNRAYQGSKRQPGSTFKILAAYAPALDSCDKTLATTIDDEPYTLKNGQVLRNANKQYGGTTTLREGIKRSINVVAVKLSDEITQELGYEYCQKFGISTLVKIRRSMEKCSMTALPRLLLLVVSQKVSTITKCVQHMQRLPTAANIINQRFTAK